MTSRDFYIEFHSKYHTLSTHREIHSFAKENRHTLTSIFISFFFHGFFFLSVLVRFLSPKFSCTLISEISYFVYWVCIACANTCIVTQRSSILFAVMYRICLCLQRFNKIVVAYETCAHLLHALQISFRQLNAQSTICETIYKCGLLIDLPF